jgi:integrase
MLDAPKTRRPKRHRKPIRFTDLSFRNIKPEAEPYEVGDAHQRGLRLYVSPTAKSWRVRYRSGGKPRVMVLQSGITLAQARKLASDAMFMLAQGKDPATERKAERERTVLADENTVAAIAKLFMQLEGGKLRSKEGRQSVIDRQIVPAIGSKNIHDVRREDVVRMLDKVRATSGPSSADMCLAVTRRLFTWFEARSSTFRSPVVKGMRRTKAAERARTRLLSDDEIQRVWAACGDERIGIYGRVLRLCILTGARRHEASRMRRSEVQTMRENGGEFIVWRLPPARSKNKREVVRPLSGAALDIINAMPVIGGDDDPFLFSISGRGPITMSEKRRKDLLDQISGVSDWVLHDLRRVHRSLLSRCRVPFDIAERLLGHSTPSLVATYDRHSHLPAMQDGIDKLAAEIARIVDGERTGKVIRLR